MAVLQKDLFDLDNRAHVEVMLGGFGGQGIILSGYILGRAATVYAGRHALMTQSYGPESRGGACKAEVILDDHEISYPRIVSPNLAVMMSQEAYGKYTASCPEDCLFIVDEDLVNPGAERNAEGRTLRAPSTRLAEEMGRRIVANIVMLGFVCGATNVVPMEAMREAVAASVPRGTETLNLRAFQVGHEHALKLRTGGEGAGRA